jgi:predicted dehydrogenase
MEKTSRREFLQNSSKIAIGAGLVSMMPLTSSCSANDKIVFGAIGLRNMGFSNIKSFLKNPNVECGAICDIDDEFLTQRAIEIEKINAEKTAKGENLTHKKPIHYKDYRQMLENKDLDAVIIGTPDHWHCLQMVHGCEAGKHIYVEKPMANSIEEVLIMERAAKRYSNSVVTVGQWQRSGNHWYDAANYVKSGALGKISRVKAWSYTSKTDLPVVPDSEVPAGVDYDMWLGPAPKLPFNQNRFHYNFRYFWDYAGGLMADWGVHMLDFALLGMNAKTPKSITALGGNFANADARETPDTLNVLYEFDDFAMSWEHSVCLGNGAYGLGHGVIFQGNNGAVLVTRGGWQVVPEKHIVDGERTNKIEEMPWAKGDNSLDEHVVNFLDVIRKGGKINCSVEMGKNVAMVAHMGNIAHRTGEKLLWDKEKNRFSNSEKANGLLVPNYREPWTLPNI